jgi:Ca-activated chloride channel homolog
MFAVLTSRRSPASPFAAICVVALLLCGSLIFSHSTLASLHATQAEQSLRFELPANGNLRVENLRGAVIVEVWSENYVSVAAIADSGAAVRSPAVIQSSQSLLSVRVPRVASNGGPINLQLRVPVRTHAAIVTGKGSVEVEGLPAALLVQTVAGEIRVDVPASASATVVAESRTGNINSSLKSASVNQNQRPQLQARLGTGANSVRLYSQAGNITLATRADATETAAGLPREITPIERRENISPRETSAPAQRPELIGGEVNKPGAGIPAKPSTGPEEVSEDEVIRVDTELVSLNVSVVDRGTSRGVTGLMKNDFRLSENSTPQEVLHFESASAPFNLVLLIDLSGSTAKVVELIKEAAIHFVEAARPFDRIGVITFAGGQVVVSPLTTDHAALRERINAIKRPDGSTRLYDSMAFAMEEVFRQAKDSRRNAIVVMSDGMDSTLPNVTGEGSTLSYDEVLRRVKEFDGMVYSIWVKTQSYVPLSVNDIQQETWDQGHDDMEEIAVNGGGAFYECKRLEDLAGSYDRVVADLGTLYTLSYRPTNKTRDGSWRTIQVNVNRANSVARGKRGYFAN